jgi:hypothetical protein
MEGETAVADLLVQRDALGTDFTTSQAADVIVCALRCQDLPPLARATPAGLQLRYQSCLAMPSVSSCWLSIERQAPHSNQPEVRSAVTPCGLLSRLLRLHPPRFARAREDSACPGSRISAERGPPACMNSVAGFGSPKRPNNCGVAARDELGQYRAQVHPIAHVQSARKLIGSQSPSLGQFTQEPFFERVYTEG